MSTALEHRVGTVLVRLMRQSRIERWALEQTGHAQFAGAVSAHSYALSLLIEQLDGVGDPLDPDGEGGPAKGDVVLVGEGLQGVPQVLAGVDAPLGATQPRPLSIWTGFNSFRWPAT